MTSFLFEQSEQSFVLIIQYKNIQWRKSVNKWTIHFSGNVSQISETNSKKVCNKKITITQQNNIP
jgi:hypothetical protein